MKVSFKRSREDSEEGKENTGKTKKRRCVRSLDRLSSLSDELLLRILSYLPIADLTLCERCVASSTYVTYISCITNRLSRRLKALSTDPQIWKALYYHHFVRPRASRIPGIRTVTNWPNALLYSSKQSKWLQDEHLVRKGEITDWKKQYKLRRNWSRGMARVKETSVASDSSPPPLLLRLRGNLVFIANAAEGLRVWALDGSCGLKTSQSLKPGEPSSLAIDTSEKQSKSIEISVGFLDGSFSIYSFLTLESRLVLRFTHAAPRKTPTSDRKLPRLSKKSISAIAYTTPYLLTMTPDALFSIYHMKDVSSSNSSALWDPPTLLSSMKSYSASNPLSLSVRPLGTGFVASVAYPLSTLNHRWSVGLQEIRIAADGTVSESRTACAPLKAPDFRYLVGDPPDHHLTSISYTHPYLLTCSRDNLLKYYMVTSNIEELSISNERTLFGHTSSVTGAHVGERGKAVSVSGIGNDLRIWNLEGSVNMANGIHYGASVRVRETESVRKATPVARNASQQWDSSSEKASGWLSFDEEKVVLLREKTGGLHALLTYDFT